MFTDRQTHTLTHTHIHTHTHRHTHTHTHTNTHTQTNCNENITPPRFCGGVTNSVMSGSTDEWVIEQMYPSLVVSHKLRGFVWSSWNLAHFICGSVLEKTQQMIWCITNASDFSYASNFVPLKLWDSISRVSCIHIWDKTFRSETCMWKFNFFFYIQFGNWAIQIII